MKKITALLVALVILTVPHLVYGQKKIAFVEKDEFAPFKGFLLSPAAYGEMKFKGEGNESLFQLRLDYEVNKAILPIQLKLDNKTVELNSYKQMCSERLSAKDDMIKFLDKKVTDAPTVWEKIDFPVGVVAGIGTTILMFLVVDKINDNFIED